MGDAAGLPAAPSSEPATVITSTASPPSSSGLELIVDADGFSPAVDTIEDGDDNDVSKHSPSLRGLEIVEDSGPNNQIATKEIAAGGGGGIEQAGLVNEIDLPTPLNVANIGQTDSKLHDGRVETVGDDDVPTTQFEADIVTKIRGEDETVTIPPPTGEIVPSREGSVWL